MSPLDLVRLTPLMKRSIARPEIRIGLIDGPVLLTHPDLAGQSIHEVSGRRVGFCSRASSGACTHGTFVAGILTARRDSVAPAISPGCTLLVRPIFQETEAVDGTNIPSATPEELAAAIHDMINRGVHVINLSAALAHPSIGQDRQLEDALDYARQSGVIIVAAAGNQGTVGSSAITRHPWVIPVAACNLQGRALSESNLAASIGAHGLRAPGDKITSLGTNGRPQTYGGTSAAAPFVTGAIALLWSEFPNASAAAVKLAVTRCGRGRRNTVVPPLLDAWAAYEFAASARSSW